MIQQHNAPHRSFEQKQEAAKNTQTKQWKNNKNDKKIQIIVIWEKIQQTQKENTPEKKKTKIRKTATKNKNTGKTHQKNRTTRKQ